MTFVSGTHKMQFAGQQSRSVIRILVLGAIGAGTLFAQSGQSAKSSWMNPILTPDQRANLVLPELTLDEKILLIHGQGSPCDDHSGPNTYLSNGGDGFSLGFSAWGSPLQMDGDAYGVRFSGINGRYSTRKLNSLEMLLLICAELGLNKAYELSAKTGIGGSLSSPGLK